MQKIGNWTLLAIGFTAGILVTCIVLDFAILEGKYAWLNGAREWTGALSGYFAAAIAIWAVVVQLKPQRIMFSISALEKRIEKLSYRRDGFNLSRAALADFPIKEITKKQDKDKIALLLMQLIRKNTDGAVSQGFSIFRPIAEEIESATVHAARQFDQDIAIEIQRKINASSIALEAVKRLKEDFTRDNVEEVFQQQIEMTVKIIRNGMQDIVIDDWNKIKADIKTSEDTIVKLTGSLAVD